MTTKDKRFEQREFDIAGPVSWAEFRDAIDTYLRDNGIADDVEIFYIDVHMPRGRISVVVSADGLEVTA